MIYHINLYINPIIQFRWLFMHNLKGLLHFVPCRLSLTVLFKWERNKILNRLIWPLRFLTGLTGLECRLNCCMCSRIFNYGPTVSFKRKTQQTWRRFLSHTTSAQQLRSTTSPRTWVSGPPLIPKANGRTGVRVACERKALSVREVVAKAGGVP